VYQIEAAKTIARKEILQAQYKIMTYRLWYIITWPSYIGKYFCVLDAVFTDLGKAWLQMPWMQNLALYLHCICTTENANKFSINCKMTKLNTQPILCAYGTRVLSFFCGSLFSDS
jgi:uncharacterized membrane protein